MNILTNNLSMFAKMDSTKTVQQDHVTGRLQAVMDAISSLKVRTAKLTLLWLTVSMAISLSQTTLIVGAV